MRVRISVVLVSLLLAGVGALVWSSSGRAFNPVVPILDCVYRTSTGNLLAVYGLTYLGMTAAFRIPEAKHVIDRGTRLFKRARR